MGKWLFCRLPCAIVAVEFGAVVLLWLFGATVFSGPESRPVKSDLVAILGGPMMFDRLVKGAELYRAGWAGYVLVTGFGEVHPSAEDWRLRYLRNQGIPLDHIITDSTASSSWLEGELVRSLMKEKSWSRVLVVSDPPHLRRLSFIYAKWMEGEGLEFRLAASSPPWWDPEHWWSNPDATLFVIDEIIKLAYYKLEYGM